MNFFWHSYKVAIEKNPKRKLFWGSFVLLYSSLFFYLHNNGKIEILKDNLLITLLLIYSNSFFIFLTILYYLKIKIKEYEIIRNSSHIFLKKNGKVLHNSKIKINLIMNIYTEEIINFYGKKNRCLFIEMLNQKKHLRFLNLHKISKENEKKIINFFLHSNDDICFGKNEFCIKKGIFDNLRSVNSICNIYDYDSFNIHDSNIKYYTEALSIIFDKTKKDKFYRYNKKNLAKNIILSHLIGILSFNTAFNFDSKESIDFLEDSFFFDSEMQSLVIRILKYYKEKNYTGDSLKDKVINNTTIYRNFVKTISNKKSTHFESTLIKITKFSFINSDFDIMEKSFSLKIASSILGVDFIIINSNIKSMEENYRKAEEERKRNIFENNEKIRKEKEKYKNHEKLKSRWREHQKKHNFMDYSVDLANNFSSFMKLGIHPTRDIRRVKKAYYDLIKKWHPDQIEYKSQQTKLEYTEKMKEINSAYEKITKNLT